MTRPMVLLRKDVAPEKWHDGFDALVAEAEGGTDGIEVSEQRTDKSGTWLTSWMEKDDSGTLITKVICPRGWAAFYRGDGRHDNTAFLHVQGW